MAKEDRDERRKARENRKNERIRVFDREWDWHDNQYSHYHSGSFVWGVGLLLVGLLLLLNSLGYVSWNVWNYIWPFWPVVLILLGIQAILGHNPFSRFVVGVLALITLGIVLLFGVTKVNPTYKNNLPPQINNVINQMNSIQIRGNFK